MLSISCSALGNAFCLDIFIPFLTGVTHVRIFGSPSTVIIQEAHFPIAQKKPLGRWYLKLLLNILNPAAYSAEATVSFS